MDPMQRATWRDALVDIFAISVMFSAVVLHYWDMRSAAPWMVAVVAGRWGATSMAKIAVARVVQSNPPPVKDEKQDGKTPSDPPPPAELAAEGAGVAIAERRSILKSAPIPSSAIVLVAIAFAAGIRELIRHSFRV